MFTFTHPHADMLVPDGTEPEQALARTTHLAISAHQDDLEIMAFHGILQCYGISEKWFTGVVCSDGAGAPRSGIYAHYTDQEMKQVRLNEQRDAARVGKYSAMLQLGYPSKAIKDPADTRLEQELANVLEITRPTIVYTHNPADKHATHVGVVVVVINAIRRLPRDQRPTLVYGCEVWRDLDWVPDEKKVVLDVGGRDNLAAALLGVFDSQIVGGKRYDLATLGRRRTHATFLESHATDTLEAATYAVDLTPMIQDDGVDIVEGITKLIEDFRQVVTQQLYQMLGH